MKIVKSLVLFVTLLWVAGVAVAQDTKLVFKLESKGEFTITLNSKAAPKTCAHIISLVERGFYNGLKFHRADRKPRPFLVQIGDPATRSEEISDSKVYRGGSGARVEKEESGLTNDLGAVGLASIPEENIPGDSQFYILLSPSKFLDGKYTVFGKVTAGLDVIQKIEKGDKVASARVVRG
ncbi:MAG TPA: peptidylprolyl isomerase [Fimbriimonas sp.]|nr:peptidylprolyl isomerase [Fimbriimonas sp.]